MLRQKLKVVFSDETEQEKFIEVESFRPYGFCFKFKLEDGTVIWLPLERVNMAQITNIEEE